jgi:hypothetical protein
MMAQLFLIAYTAAYMLYYNYWFMYVVGTLFIAALVMIAISEWQYRRWKRDLK